ncbi:hypothetical protein MSAN_02030200 [Mycena sanguinolenta]|uniref:Uncharacterized protein n=1 Tax=Mycena sanguinolenta TaxID=230812 RepID=A0A8H6XJI2_9AGAR|nr:hypothetical protein MSAN_02030200 [Mycena sanguinolenta]
MDPVEPRITVDLSQAIKITNVHLNAILSQHAQQLAELDDEDPPAAPLHAHSVVFGPTASPLPPVDSTAEGLKRARSCSPQFFAQENAAEGGKTDPVPHAASHRPRKKKRPEKHKANRQEKRAQIQATDEHTRQRVGLASKIGISRTRRRRAAQSAAEADDIPLSQSGLPPRRMLDLASALAEPGMRLITLDMQGQVSTKAIMDADNQVIAVLNCGPSGAEDWNEVTQQASTAMDAAAKLLYGPDYDKAPPEQDIDSPRRGPHYAVHMGNGMGGGQQRPTPFALHASVLHILTSLFIHRAIARFVGLANVLFQLYAPKLHNYYFRTMKALSKWDRDLPLLAPLCSCVFACVTFNFGPQTVTLPHLDFLNLSWGWCFITALGWYDYRRGGHLILWDLRLIIEFPPGATFAIPSAILRHSNVSIQQGEKRFSFTQYTSAGIFRFVNRGFQTDVTLKANMSKAEQREFAATAQTRYSEGLKMYSTLEELKMRAFM